MELLDCLHQRIFPFCPFCALHHLHHNKYPVNSNTLMHSYIISLPTFHSRSIQNEQYIHHLVNLTLDLFLPTSCNDTLTLLYFDVCTLWQFCHPYIYRFAAPLLNINTLSHLDICNILTFCRRCIYHCNQPLMHIITL